MTRSHFRPKELIVLGYIHMNANGNAGLLRLASGINRDTWP